MCALERPLHPMPADVRQAIDVAGLRDEYDARPPYQRNDYLSWIDRSMRIETRAKRTEQMLGELRAGDVYMNMAWSAGSAPEGAGGGVSGGAD